MKWMCDHNDVHRHHDSNDTMVVMKMMMMFAVIMLPIITIVFKMMFKNSLIIHKENTKKNHKLVVSLYVIEISLDLHKL